jgi:hypothetical protein
MENRDKNIPTTKVAKMKAESNLVFPIVSGRRLVGFASAARGNSDAKIR